VKLLFDENLSPRLAQQHASDFPGSAHVDVLGLHGKPDAEIWAYARSHGFAIVSKDDDFRVSKDHAAGTHTQPAVVAQRSLEPPLVSSVSTLHVGRVDLFAV